MIKYRSTLPIAMGSLLLAFSLVSTPVAANPSSKEPARILAVHGTIEGAKELASQLAAIYEEAAKFVDQTYARIDDPSSFSDRQLSDWSGRLWKARRDARRLQVMGEPAGHDLFKRLQPLATEVYKFGQAYRGTPEGNRLAQRVLAKLQKEKPQMQRFLQQADAALQQGKLEVFETQMEKKGQELNEQLVFFTSAESQPFDETFNAILTRGDSALEAKRKEAYAEQVSVLLEQQLAKVAGLAEEASRVASEIASTGTAKLGSDTTGGPVEAFAYIGSQWGAASAAGWRATALRWAFPAAKTSASVDPADLKQIATAALVQVAEAAVQSTPAEDVPAVYAGLLPAIASIDRRIGVNSEELRRSCEPALEKLAAKNPEFASQTAAYERATSEVLRWRRAYAAEQAARLGRGAARAETLLTQVGESNVQVRPPYVRKPMAEMPVAPPLLMEPAMWMVQEAAAKLVGQALMEDRVVRFSPSINVAVAPYAHSHYANVPVPLAAEPHVTDLLTALLVDDDHPALTIAAADAVSSAQSQDYETVIGQIDSVHLESIVTRLISLPDAAYALVNLGGAVTLNETVPAIDHACWRLDLRPLVARHAYFTVRLGDVTSP